MAASINPESSKMGFRNRVGARSGNPVTPSGLRGAGGQLRGANASRSYGPASSLREKPRTTIQKATNIENQFRYALLRKGIDFIEQADIGPWSCDFLLPEHAIVIEADGEYWHSDPKTKRKDRRKDLWLQSKGFMVLHFDGKTITQSADHCVEKVLELIEKKNKQTVDTIDNYVATELSEEIVQIYPPSFEEEEENEDAEYEQWITGHLRSESGLVG